MTASAKKNLTEDRPEDLARTWRALESYPKVKTRIREALDRLGVEATERLIQIIDE